MAAQAYNAIHCLAKCEQLVENGLNPPNKSKILVTSKLVTCYTRLNELERAEGYLEELKQLVQPSTSTMDLLSINMLEAELFHKIDNVIARDGAIHKLETMQLDDIHVLDAFSELCQYAQLLLETDKFSSFLSLMKRIEAKVWDYLHFADMALYRVKKQGKNNYCIGSSGEEIQEYSSVEIRADEKE